MAHGLQIWRVYRVAFIVNGSQKASAPRSSSGLGRRPLTAVTRVQIPYGVQMAVSASTGCFFFFGLSDKMCAFLGVST